MNNANGDKTTWDCVEFFRHEGKFVDVLVGYASNGGLITKIHYFYPGWRPKELRKYISELKERGNNTPAPCGHKILHLNFKEPYHYQKAEEDLIALWPYIKRMKSILTEKDMLHQPIWIRPLLLPVEIVSERKQSVLYRKPGGGFGWIPSLRYPYTNNPYHLFQYFMDGEIVSSEMHPFHRNDAIDNDVSEIIGGIQHIFGVQFHNWRFRLHQAIETINNVIIEFKKYLENPRYLTQRLKESKKAGNYRNIVLPFNFMRWSDRSSQKAKRTNAKVDTFDFFLDAMKLSFGNYLIQKIKDDIPFCIRRCEGLVTCSGNSPVECFNIFLTEDRKMKHCSDKCAKAKYNF